MKITLPAVPGVYAIVNGVTGDEYIGCARSVRRRLYAHRTGLRRGNHHNPRLQEAWNRFGETAFHAILLRPFPNTISLSGLEIAERLVMRQRSPAYNVVQILCPYDDAKAETYIQSQIAAESHP